MNGAELNPPHRRVGLSNADWHAAAEMVVEFLAAHSQKEFPAIIIILTSYHFNKDRIGDHKAAPCESEPLRFFFDQPFF